MQKELLALTEELIRFRSTADQPDALNACADFVAGFFSGTELEVARSVANGVPSIVVSKHTKTPTVFLSGHFDVVPGDDAQFVPRVVGDRLYGRGALDMKSGVAVMMLLMKRCATTPHDVGLMLTGDEEQGGFHGTGRLVDEGYRSRVAIIPDGGEAIDRMVVQEKGILRITVRATGRAAHASAPWKGTNAILLLVDALQRIQTVFPPCDQHKEDHWATTISVGRIVGGTVVNQVPAEAVAYCDIRYVPTDDPGEIVAQIAAVLPAGVVVEKTLCEPATAVQKTDPFLGSFIKVLQQYKKTPILYSAHGASDGRFFHARGIPVIMSQPDGAGHHGPEEWVHIPAIEQYYRVLEAYLDRVGLRE
jgi:succinyl-diaminopimelate desuccinylase